MSTSYHLPNIRSLFLEGFTIEELRGFCHDVPDFRPVYDKVGENAGKAEIVDAMLEHADRESLVELLLAWAKETHPGEYNNYQPYINPSPSPLPPPSPSDDPWSGAVIGGLIGAGVSIIVGGYTLMPWPGSHRDPAFLSCILGPFIALSLGWIIAGSLAGGRGERRVLDGIYGEPTLSLLARGALAGLITAVVWLLLLSCLFPILH